jgi:hypothetical protein
VAHASPGHSWKGRRGRELKDERGDETRERFVSIASDMIWVVSKRFVEATASCENAIRPRECAGIKVGIVFGGVMLALET